MTLSERNILFKAGIVFCAISTIFILLASFLVVPLYPSMEENARRPAVFSQFFTGMFLNANYFAVHASVIMSVLFSLAGIIMIHSFFEQTSAPEILFIAFFTISLSFETIRLILPLNIIYDIPSFYLLLASRILLFARYFGVFSLFAASVYAAGLDMQRTSTIILIIIIASLVITFGVLIDIQNWDTSFNTSTGYISMLRLIDGVMFIASVIGFFIAVNVRGSKYYAHVGIGVMLALAGRNLLLVSDNLACPVPGILMLSIGTWLICSKLHRIYLWL